MNKAYSRIDWENYPSDATPINEENLNAMDASIDEIDDRVVTMDASKATKTEVATTITNVSFDESTGVFTFTRKNGTSFTVNTLLEKIATNFKYDYSTQALILTLVDGTKQTIDLSALLTQYEFTDSSTINFEVDSSGKVTAKIINGSITDAMLESGYLSKVTTQATKAQTNATKSQSYAVGGTNSRDGEDTDNAKYYYTKSKEMFDTLVGAGDIDTVTTTDTTLSNSKASIAKINAIRGNSEQKSYSGKNFLDNITTSRTVNGVTITVNKDKSITLNGTVETTFNFEIGTLTLKAGEYKINGFLSGGGATTYQTTITDKTSGNVVKYVTSAEDYALNPTSDTRYEVRQYLYKGTTFNNQTFYPMIRPASIEDATYEPYVGGIASPNPQYKQDINSSGDSGSITFRSHGRNCYDASKRLRGYYDSNGDLVIGNSTYLFYEYPWKENTQYTFSAYVKNGVTSSNVRFKIKYTDGTETASCLLNQLTEYAYRTTTSEANKTISGLYVSYGNSGNMFIKGGELMIEEGTTATPYEPYTESTFTIPLSEPLRGIDDVKDDIVKQDGVWGVLRDITSLDLGSLTWTTYSSANLSYYSEVIALGKTLCMCESYRYENVAPADLTDKALKIQASNGRVYLRDTDYSGATSLTNALQGVILYHETATPTFEPFADEVQELFYQLESYDNVTHITTDSKVQPTIEWECAVTDAGAHMLNNYAKSNLAELKADNALSKSNITQSTAVTEEGIYVVDAVELNPSADGTLANKVALCEVAPHFTYISDVSNVVLSSTGYWDVSSFGVYEEEYTYDSYSRRHVLIELTVSRATAAAGSQLLFSVNGITYDTTLHTPLLISVVDSGGYVRQAYGALGTRWGDFDINFVDEPTTGIDMYLRIEFTQYQKK